MTTPDAITHRRELARFGAFLVLVGVLFGLSYLLPSAAALQPWRPGEPVPLAHLFTDGRQVVEDDLGEVVVADAPPPAATAADAAPDAVPAQAGPSLPSRPPAKGAFLEVPTGALDSWFDALARVEAGQPGLVVRALHWGDSTIAADGITVTVRQRLQARFGDGGPGFMAVHADPQWNSRQDAGRYSEGDWASKSITFAGADVPYYGLAGVVSTATGVAHTTLTGRKIDGKRQPLQRFDLHYQCNPTGGVLHVKPAGVGGATLDTRCEKTGDAYRELRSPGSTSVRVWNDGEAPVTAYGIALETAGPGVTWESFGVAGAGQGSMLTQAGRHLSRQVARRDPSLLVYLTGGNELSYPTLNVGSGAKYQETYELVLGRLKAGAPQASCLVMSPLDQGVRERGVVVSKPMLDRMVDLQRKAAYSQGCAFWDARAAMGGSGSFQRWLGQKPPLAWTDLIHLSGAGLEIMGNSMADALEFAYDHWKAAYPDRVAAIQAEVKAGRAAAPPPP